MRFEEVCEGWTEKRPIQIDAARLPSICPRTFRRALNPLGRLGGHRYEEDGLAGHDAASGRQPAAGLRGRMGT